MSSNKKPGRYAAIRARRAFSREDALAAGLALEHFPDSAGAQRALDEAAALRMVVRELYRHRRGYGVTSVRRLVAGLAESIRAEDERAVRCEGQGSPGAMARDDDAPARLYARDLDHLWRPIARDDEDAWLERILRVSKRVIGGPESRDEARRSCAKGWVEAGLGCVVASLDRESHALTRKLTEQMLGGDAPNLAVDAGLRLERGASRLVVEPYRGAEFINRVIGFEGTGSPASVIERLVKGERVRFDEGHTGSLVGVDIAKERERLAAAEEYADARLDAMEVGRRGRVLRRYERHLAATGHGSSVGATQVDPEGVHVIVERALTGVIDEDAPSMGASHLLGREGERGARIGVEVRECPACLLSRVTEAREHAERLLQEAT